MDRRAFLRNSLIGFTAGSWGIHSSLSPFNTAIAQATPRGQRPRVIVISDIKVGRGDPDDRQSMAHLMMYANELDIRGIWPDDINSGGRGTRIVLDLYEQDYNNRSYKFQDLDYPTPSELRTKLFTSHAQAISAIKTEAGLADPRPIYMLVWGGTHRVHQSLERLTSQEQSKIRLISIGTYLLDNALANGDGRRYNWNAWGDARMRVWNQFPDLWWLEMDWSWLGMVFNQNLRVANEVISLNNMLAQDGGALGAHIKEVFPRYFRALDTNSVLYLLDPSNTLNDPTKGSWAGRYYRPFSERPNYYIGIDGGYAWDYRNPVNTWNNATNVFIARISTCISQRSAWHQAFTQKVQQLYGHDSTNDIPVVDAGTDISIKLPADSVTLRGTGVEVGCAIASYEWTQISGPETNLRGARTPELTVSSLAAGSYLFRLTVTDVCGARGTDDVQVTVLPPNQGPVANAGPDQTVTDTDGNGTERVVLNGTGSADGDGRLVSYLWTQGNTTLALSNVAGSVTVTLAVGTHTLTLTVTDDNGATATDTVTITVKAGASDPDDNGSDPPNDGTLYRAINLNGATISVDGITFEGKNAPNYSTSGRTHTSSTTPSPAVGNGKKAMLQSFIWGRPVSVNLSSVPNGNYRVFLWVFEDNNSVTFSVSVNGRSVLSDRRSGAAGTWQRLDLGLVTVSNGRLAIQGNLSSDALNICAIEVWRGGGGSQNQGPTANAGPNQTVTDTDGNGTQQVTLSGTNSTDSDGSIVSYVWKEGNTTLATTATAAVNLAVGVHTITLTVTDNNGATDSDTVTVTVNARANQPQNQPPTANAGANQTVTDTDRDGTERVILNGTGSADGDGSIVSYLWTKGSTTLATTATAPIDLAVGVHTITLTVTDNEGATANDTVVITVKEGTSPPDNDDSDASGTLYRAINLNGNAVSVDGVSFEGKNAPNYSTAGRTHITRTAPSPAVPADKQAMLQSFIWGRPVRVTMTNIPNRAYRVYLWVMEDNSSVTFSVTVNGRSVLTNRQSGGAGTWRRLDLGAVTISNGRLVVQGNLSRDALNMCALEIWRS